MAQTGLVEEVVREYAAWRGGWGGAARALEAELRADRERGFRPDRLLEQLLQHVHASELAALRDHWRHLDALVLNKLEVHFQPAVRKLEHGLYKLYLVVACNNNRAERVTEFLARMQPELQGQPDWRDWFMLPFVSKPEENAVFSMYFTRGWQDTLLLSLHNLFATIFQCMPQPTLASYESDVALVKRLQDENATLKAKLASCEKGWSAGAGAGSGAAAAAGHQSRLSQYSERLNGPLPLVDDFYLVYSESLESGVREARGLRGLIRQMGGSPVQSRRQARSLSQN